MEVISRDGDERVDEESTPGCKLMTTRMHLRW